MGQRAPVFPAFMAFYGNVFSVTYETSMCPIRGDVKRKFSPFLSEKRPTF